MNTKKIHHTSVLVKDGEVFPEQTRRFTSLEALDHCYTVHLGWGGAVLDITSTFIKIRSRCMGNVDTDTYNVYEKDEQELKSLYVLCKAWNELEASRASGATKLTGITAGLAKNLGLDMESGTKIKTVLFKTISEHLLEKHTDHKLIQKVILATLKQPPADALAIFDMLVGEDLPPADVLSLLQ